MNPYGRGSSETFYYQFIFQAYDAPVMLSYGSIKYTDFSAIKKGFEDDTALVVKVFDRPYDDDSLGFVEIHNHTFTTIKCNNQNIDPGMAALFAAIFKKSSYSPKLKMDSDSLPVFGFSNPHNLYPKYIKKSINFMNDCNIMEPNKDLVYVLENPDNQSGEDLLALLKYCKDGSEKGFPLNQEGDRYYNPLNHSKHLLKIYKRFEGDPEMFEMGLERDYLLITYTVSQKIIKEAGETSKKMKIT